MSSEQRTLLATRDLAPTVDVTERVVRELAPHWGLEIRALMQAGGEEG